MLQRLTIEDYGLIPHADVDFARGATVFTGETGSGKTMVLGALAFVLGERASADVVRSGRSRTYVTLTLAADGPLRTRLSQDGFPLEDDEDPSIARELSAQTGKSAMRVNGRPATAAYVRELLADLVDIAGQHEAQRLLSPSYHLEMLDRFAGPAAFAKREAVAALHTRRADLVEQIAGVDRNERHAQDEAHYARFALEEIEAATPIAGEDEQLAQRARILRNAEKIVTALQTAHAALAGDNAAQDALGVAAAGLAGIASIAEDFADMAAVAAALQSDVNELAVRTTRALDAVEFDAGEVEAVNARLDVLDNLKRKYGGTLEAVLASVARLRSAIELVEHKEERQQRLRDDLAACTAQLQTDAHELSTLRQTAAARLRRAVEKELKDLALPAARFEVEFTQNAEITRNGTHSVQFAFAANKGEPARPLARIASGGELSRVLLALVVVLAGARSHSALVFDEIDAGVGGATANAVGTRLGRLAQHAQVVCVTHLAQIASWADTHYVLDKHESRGSTTIEVRRISDDIERTTEVARMLSGETHEAAMEHARTLLLATMQRRLAV